jgi:hypothetical protein
VPVKPAAADFVKAALRSAVEVPVEKEYNEVQADHLSEEEGGGDDAAAAGGADAAADEEELPRARFVTAGKKKNVSFVDVSWLDHNNNVCVNFLDLSDCYVSTKCGNSGMNKVFCSSGSEFDEEIGVTSIYFEAKDDDDFISVQVPDDTVVWLKARGKLKVKILKPDGEIAEKGEQLAIIKSWRPAAVDAAHAAGVAAAREVPHFAEPEPVIAEPEPVMEDIDEDKRSAIDEFHRENPLLQKAMEDVMKTHCKMFETLFTTAEDLKAAPDSATRKTQARFILFLYDTVMCWLWLVLTFVLAADKRKDQGLLRTVSTRE